MTDSDRLDSIAARLEQLAQHRDFSFRHTPKEVAERYLRAMVEFRGLSVDEVMQLERDLDGPCPDELRGFLLRFGRSYGRLFRGSDVAFAPDEVKDLCESADELLREAGDGFTLAKNDFVFLMHQGYTFCYVRFDVPHASTVYQYMEGDGPPRVASTSFIDFVEAEVQAMEEVTRESRRLGGHFLTVFPDGGEHQEHPALASRFRPIDVGDVFE